MEAQVNCGITAMNMQALKGRVPNNQSQYFMQNSNNNLLGMAMNVPNIVNGTVAQQPQPQDQLAQIVELAKASQDDKPKSDIRIVKLEKNFAALSKSIEAIADALPKK